MGIQIVREKGSFPKVCRVGGFRGPVLNFEIKYCKINNEKGQGRRGPKQAPSRHINAGLVARPVILTSVKCEIKQAETYAHRDPSVE